MNSTVIICIAILIALLVTLGAIIFGLRLIQDKIAYLATGIKHDIKKVVEPKFIDISPSTSSLVELAVEVWRVEKRLSKAAESLSEDQNKAFENSSAKLRRFLDKSDITFVDYTDQKYNEGLNVDVLSIEKDPAISESIIKETHEPAVFHKGQLVKKAKVVIYEK